MNTEIFINNIKESILNVFNLNTCILCDKRNMTFKGSMLSTSHSDVVSYRTGLGSGMCEMQR